MKAGRPPGSGDYSDQVLSDAKDYLQNHADYDDAVPSLAGLACHLRKTRQCLYNWRDEHEEFAEVLDWIQTTQERKLITGGLTGAMTPVITKLMLCNHGYAEKQDNTLSGPNSGPIKHDHVVEFIGVNADRDS